MAVQCHLFGINLLDFIFELYGRVRLGNGIRTGIGNGIRQGWEVKALNRRLKYVLGMCWVL